MKQVFKKVLVFTLSCLLLLQGMTVTAEEIPADIGGRLTVGSAYVESGESFSLSVVLENNPGINALSLEPIYDETVLQLDSIKAGDGIWHNGMIDRKYVWVNFGGDSTENGTVISLKFTALETTAVLDTTVSVAYDGSNLDEENPPITVVDGKVTVAPEKSGFLKVGSASCISGNLIEIPVIFEDNPGLCAMVIEPIYDHSVLRLEKMIAGEGVWQNSSMTHKYVWATIEGDATDCGTVLTLVFEVLDTAPHGNTTVSVLYDGSDSNEKTPSVIPIDGTVTIHPATDVVIDEAIPASCIEDGLTEGSHCLTCGEVFVAQDIIPAHGHDFEEEFTIDVEPTEETPGQRSRHCRNCTEITDVTEMPPCKKGDVNSDSKIDSKDLTRLMKTIAGEGIFAFGTDLNGDGKVDTKDITRLMKFLAGYEVELG